MALGVWAARRGFLDAPARHVALLRRTTALGIPVAVLAGLPRALTAAQLWTSPPLAAVVLAGTVHTLGGQAGGLGYAAAFGLLAMRIGGAPGPFVRAVQACGQRSLSCYLAQSVAFAALLPAWTLGLGDGAHLWQAALVAIGVWLVIRPSRRRPTGPDRAGRPRCCCAGRPTGGSPRAPERVSP